MIGTAVSRRSKALGYTLQPLAELTSIHKVTISEIENGQFTDSFDIFERLLDAIGLQFSVAPKTHKLPDWDYIDSIFMEDD
ncbi:helix-turn-helix domain-containing protein [Shewanella sp.]|uniref:helix-turn-helix domain-containing protein n=1 Tax=Shewanella sp. TaxID=50422 RepID=UPI00404893B4